jgi:hypothetical protein
MGRVRSLDFEAVIGLGGQGAEAESNDIAGKLNWIGVGAHKDWVEVMADPIVTFDHFLDFGTEGDDLWLVAPALAKRMYVKKARIALTFAPQEQTEVDKLLALAETEPPSGALAKTAPRKKRLGCPLVRC